MVDQPDRRAGGVEQLAADLGRELDRHHRRRLLAEGVGRGIGELGGAPDQPADRARHDREQALLRRTDRTLVGHGQLDQALVDAVAQQQLADPLLVAGDGHGLVDQLRHSSAS